MKTKNVLSKMRDTIELRSFIRAKRRELHMSQTKFGKLLGYHGQYVSNVERGIHFYPLQFCITLMKVLSLKEQNKLRKILSLQYEIKVSDKIRNGREKTTKKNKKASSFAISREPR